MIVAERTPVAANRADQPTEFENNGAYAIRLHNLTVGEGSVSDFAGPPIYMAPDGWIVDASFNGVTDMSRRAKTGHPLESIEISQSHFTPGDVSLWHRSFKYPRGFDGPINVKVYRVVNSVAPDGSRNLNVRQEQAIGSAEVNGEVTSTADPEILDLRPGQAMAIVEGIDSFLIKFLDAQHNAKLPSPIAYK